MPKKSIFIGLILLLLFFAVSPKRVYADCTGMTPYQIAQQAICGHPLTCTSNNTWECQSASSGQSGQTQNVCQFAGAKSGDCETCMGKGEGAWTAIGCITTTPSGFIKSFLDYAVGIGGGIAFLLILFGGYQILTSAGNPEQLTAGRDLVTSAITGLLLIVFSIFLLGFIGNNILGIPGFGSTSTQQHAPY